MRIIKSEILTKETARLCGEANYYLGNDIIEYYDELIGKEQSESGVEVLKQLKENALICKNENKAICQDTGMAVIFVEIGEEVFVEGNINEAIEEGIRKGYSEYYLRKSIVKDPLFRENTKDNTPG